MLTLTDATVSTLSRQSLVRIRVQRYCLLGFFNPSIFIPHTPPRKGRMGGVLFCIRGVPAMNFNLTQINRLIILFSIKGRVKLVNEQMLIFLFL